MFPQNVVWYFWLSKVVNNTETLITKDGENANTVDEATFLGLKISPYTTSSTFPETDNILKQMQALIPEVKRRTLFTLQLDGVECSLYKRRFGSDKPFGIPCPCIEDDPATPDRDFRGRERCSLCFGTGILGGYYAPMDITVRFNVMPAKNFKGTIRGLSVNQTYEAWTMWTPLLVAQDMILRKYDGTRWIVSEVAHGGPIRGVITHQNLSLNLVGEIDIRRIVSLDTINHALSLSTDAKYNPTNSKSF
jgi:hypothetical protein